MFAQIWFLTYWGVLVVIVALEALFPQHPAPADRGRRWPTNFAFALLNSLIASVAPVLTVWSTQWAVVHDVGVLNWISVPGWLAFFISVTVQSMAGYGFHLYAHVNPVLWRFHRVHHSDVHLDVTSTLRHHPLEIIAMTLSLAPIYVIGGLAPYAVIFYETAVHVVGLASHANVRIPDQIERIARCVFVTPAVHRLHHSTFQEEADSNFGDLFLFWDRIFGTYRRASSNERGPARFGLENIGKERAGDFIEQLKLPWCS
jgi:sterol desaturase/sphingolipid hydroxylase (fatty acid hydroxylase superfamily)